MNSLFSFANPMTESAKYLAGIAIAAIATITALAACWLVDSFGGGLPPTGKWIVWGCGVAIAAGATFVLGQRLRERQDQLRRQLDRICRGEYSGDSQSTEADQSEFSSDDPWHATLQAVEHCLQSQSQRLCDAEDARALAEVRARRLSGERDHLAQVLTHLSQPILAVNAFHEVTFANAAAARLFGCSELGEERQAVSTLGYPALSDLLRDTGRRKPPYQRMVELDWTGRDGRQHSYAVTLRALEPAPGASLDDSRRGQGAIAIFADHSQVKAIQKRNAEFVAAVSHEMKTPLAGIKAYVELLVDGEAEDAATREEFLGVINGQADRLKRLIDNLLNLSRIEAGVVNVDKQSHSLNDLLEEALRVVQPSAEQKRVALSSDLSQLYLGVSADRDMLLQAAINLLSNAVKYTHAGGSVLLRSRLKDDAVLFEVEDTGVGLSPEDCERVFERFYRVKKDKEMAPGTGLGLPLAKHIVEDVHGGSLTLSSVLGQGSTFRVTLPQLVRANDKPTEARSPMLVKAEA